MSIFILLDSKNVFVIVNKVIVRIEDVLKHQVNLLSELKRSINIASIGLAPDYLISGPTTAGQDEFAEKLSLIVKKELVTLNYYELDFSNAYQIDSSLKKFWSVNEDKLIYIQRLEEFLSSNQANAFLNIVQDLMLVKSKNENSPVIVISGDSDAIEKIHAVNPALYSLFYRATARSLSSSEIAELIVDILNSNNRKVEKNFINEATKLLSKSSGNGNLRNVSIAKGLALDLIKKIGPGNEAKSHDLDLKQIRLILASETQAFDELNNLVGLEEIKKTVFLWATNVGLFERRKELGLVTPGAGQHMVFKGPAGTAKTTVARIVAKILAETSVLASGHLVEIDRGAIIADSAEQTARNVTNSVKQAIGGVLFIDEAYSLTNNNLSNGKVAIDTLLKLMEDYRDEFIVIVAGYPSEMETFLSSNPGLRSRFVKVLNFPSYSVDELLKILHHLAKQRGFKIDVEVDDSLKPRLNLQSQYPGFGNGRHVRNILDAAIELQGTRVNSSSSDEEIVTLIKEDFAENSKYKIKL